jgi:hypothetical protein
MNNGIMFRSNTMDNSEPRKEYVKPEILHELELETRAGSPVGLDDPFNLLKFED